MCTVYLDCCVLCCVVCAVQKSLEWQDVDRKLLKMTDDVDYDVECTLYISLTPRCFRAGFTNTGQIALY